jgi:hypothetical protein
VRYVLFAVLLFAPLAVAGTYLSGDPTSTEVPEIHLRTTVDSVPDKPKGAKSVRKQDRRRTRSTPTAKPKANAPPAATVAPAPPPAPTKSAGHDDRRVRQRGAEPVPTLPPATAGPRSGDDEGDDDGEDDGEGDGEDDGEGDGEGERSEGAGEGEERTDDGDD